MVITVAAVISALRKRFKSHQTMMLRSYALMFGFVRLDNHMLGTPLEVPLATGVDRASMVIWMAWVVPLVAIEFFVTWLPAALGPRRRQHAPSAPPRLRPYASGARLLQVSQSRARPARDDASDREGCGGGRAGGVDHVNGAGGVDPDEVVQK